MRSPNLINAVFLVSTLFACNRAPFAAPDESGESDDGETDSEASATTHEPETSNSTSSDTVTTSVDSGDSGDGDTFDGDESDEGDESVGDGDGNGDGDGEPLEIVITEFMVWDYIEVYNPGPRAVDMVGCAFSSGDQWLEIDASLVVPAGGFALLTDRSLELDDPFEPPQALITPNFVWDAENFDTPDPQGAGQLLLLCDKFIVDEISFPGEFAGAPTGCRSWSLDPEAMSTLGNNDEGMWCYSPISTGNTVWWDFSCTGSPGVENAPCED